MTKTGRPPRYAPEADELRRRLRPLLAARGPSGYEAEPVRAWVERAREFAKVRVDPLGSGHAVVNPGGTPKIALLGHIDEIGLGVSHIDEAGRLWVTRIGGWDAAILYGQHVTVLAEGGRVPGVIGTAPPHLTDGDSVPKMDGVWIDIGATGRADAETVVSVGDPAVLGAAPVDLRNGRIAAPALDNRLGALAVLEAARAAATASVTAEVTAVASVREETSYHGALGAVHAIGPDFALAVDTTFASDVPAAGIERRTGRHPLGSGPVIGRGAVTDEPLARTLRILAGELEIPYTIEAYGTESGSDADAMAAVGAGIRCGVVSIPIRHMHSAGELADPADLAATIDLVTAFCLAGGTRGSAS
ncbi:zinc-binding metallopeptidase family protein [Amycolatopsis samaneae]|uniref:Endoglucanase n=1 Tax=Amycolatopsis samaneae TaxID=664691 RepID=A0ABW5GUU4_9PSEU